LKSLGCLTVVELSNIGMGRDVKRLAALAQSTEINIIAATGFYVQTWHPAWVADRSVDELAQLMINELEYGIDGTAIRAGIIGEVGTSKDAITQDEDKVMRAAARAHLRTGRPISTHTSFGNLPLQQIDILREELIPLQYVVIGHLDLAPNFDDVIEVARRGAYVQFDTFGKEAYQPESVRIARLVDLVERGYGNSLLVSCDISRNTYMKAYGGYGYDHFLRRVVPELKGRGLTDQILNTILVENPRRLLAGRWPT
jgi:phosphotriesterase-related protein